MAIEGEVSGEFRQGGGTVSSPNGAQSGNLDAVAAGLPAELTDFSSEMKQVRPSGADEEARSESKVDLEEIKDEIERTLMELEDLKFQATPTSGRKEVSAEPLSSFAMSLKQSTAVSAPKPGDKTGELKGRSLEDKSWDNLEIFRTRVDSAEFRRRRNIFLGLTAVALAIIVGSLYFFGQIGANLP